MIVERIRLDGRVVVVSGAGGGGIGSMTARAMAEAGATVLAVDVRQEPLDALAADLAGDKLQIVPHVADVTTDDGVEQVGSAVDDLVARHGPVRGLVNVVGGALAPDWGPAFDVTRADWRRTIALNLETAMFVSQAVARRMAADGGGSVVCLSSTSGIGASPFHSAYGAAKGALVSLVRTLALEWAQHDIRVNAIAPGTIRTPRAGEDPGDAERDRRGVPLARRGDATEIAAAALFLVSDLASYVTGQCLPVDGGTSAKHVHLGDDNVPIFVRNEAILSRITG
jgi:NAD(P)-dependent dehydrogenase (short-subunit alcohol dehydrogenase family)